MAAIRVVCRNVKGRTSFIAFMALSATLLLASATAQAQTGDTPPGPAYVANADTCPDNASLAKLSALGSIYIGEVHGSNESPRLLECLVNDEVAAGVHPLFVSFELPPFARDTTSLVWSGQDGRTSKAMAELIQHMEGLEKTGKVILHFQLQGDLNADNVNRIIGTGLRDLARKGRVIALGGNFHAARNEALLPGVKIQPAGAFTGNAIKSVLLDATGHGEAWICQSADHCGPHSTASFAQDPKLGDLVDGRKYGFDYVYFVPAYTPSAPYLAAVKNPAP